MAPLMSPAAARVPGPGADGAAAAQARPDNRELAPGVGVLGVQADAGLQRIGVITRGLGARVDQLQATRCIIRMALLRPERFPARHSHRVAGCSSASSARR